MGVSVVILSACGEDEPEVKSKIYENVTQCEADVEKSVTEDVPAMTVDDCKAQFEVARTAHETQAPKYADKAMCEQEFGTGNCETKETPGTSGDGGSSFFMPMMMGYMMGSSGNQGGNTYVNNRYHDDRDRDRPSGAAAARSSYYSTPLYRPYSGGSPGVFVTPNGTSLGTSSTGKISTAPSSFKASPSATVVSRGGFAARSAGFAAS
jgi:uncharacterized protein YgiB involved in biofilm formation